MGQTMMHGHLLRHRHSKWIVWKEIKINNSVKEMTLSRVLLTTWQKFTQSPSLPPKHRLFLRENRLNCLSVNNKTSWNSRESYITGKVIICIWFSHKSIKKSPKLLYLRVLLEKYHNNMQIHNTFSLSDQTYRKLKSDFVKAFFYK